MGNSLPKCLRRLAKAGAGKDGFHNACGLRRASLALLVSKAVPLLPSGRSKTRRYPYRPRFVHPRRGQACVTADVTAARPSPAHGDKYHGKALLASSICRENRHRPGLIYPSDPGSQTSPAQEYFDSRVSGASKEWSSSPWAVRASDSRGQDRTIRNEGHQVQSSRAFFLIASES